MRIAALLLLLAGCAGGSVQIEDGAVTISMPRAAAQDELVTVRVRAGALPRGAVIVVRTATGRIAGSIAPYGVKAGDKAGTHTIPIPEGAVKDGKLPLRFEVQQKGSATRKATKAEVEDVRVTFVPAVRREQ